MSRTPSPEMYIIVAMTQDHIIGNDNNIPWHIPEDLKNFKRITSGGVVIMGRKTFESIGRPLPNRHNLIVSKTLASVEGCEVFSNLEGAVERATQFDKKVFFIGGAEIYKKALDVVQYMYISWVFGDIEGDTMFPVFDDRQWEPIKEESFEKFRLVLYQRKRRIGGT